ncbi:MAG: enoyl-CoA hydratase/isomerase family protein, partial [Acidobacteriaceae bacterium]|nr:enoyl-CoA hydratase/isomerase family protein [Acidobacteriaceae bacterium]
MADLVKLESDQDVAVITIDNPPVNAISPGVPEGILAKLSIAVADQAIRAIVVAGSGQTFIAGADIRELAKVMSGEKPLPDLLSFLQAIEDSTKPVVMAIHGTAFGGGLETAMAGHYRVIAPSAQVGQPEVKLGLIPGMGGTQRLPRLAGPMKAAEMCALGEPISAAEAVQAGIADRFIEGELLAGAVAFARAVADKPVAKTRERNEKLHQAGSGVFDDLRQRASKLRRGQKAPLAAIDAVEAATRLTFEEGCTREQELFRECLFSTESKALIHVFFGERTAAKPAGIKKDARVVAVERAAVIGAGTMGGGIA